MTAIDGACQPSGVSGQSHEVAVTRQLGQQPWRHEYDITVDGPVTVVSERRGDLSAPGTGIVVDDRRVVRTIRLCLDDVAGAGADPAAEVHRRRTTTGLTMTETITLRARCAGTVTTSLSLLVDGDGAEIAEIKDGRAPQAALAVVVEHQGWSDDRHSPTLEAAPPADEVVPAPDGGLLLRWHWSRPVPPPSS